MNIINRIRTYFGQTSGVTNPAPWLVDWFGGGASDSGNRVTVESALGQPAVWSSVRTIAGHTGCTPMEIHRRLPSGGSEVMPNNPAHRLLNQKPNPLQTAFTFKQTLMVHALLQGNGRAVIMRNALGQPYELIIMFPSNTCTVMVDGQKWHCVWFDPTYLAQSLPYGPSNVVAGGQSALYKIPDKDVLHIPGLGYNGLWGYRLLDIAKNVFGLDDAGLQSASYMFKNNGRPNLILEAERGTFTTHEEAARFLQHFRAAHEGIDNTGRTGLLRDGMKAKPLPMDAADAQYLESRRFSREDIALLLGTEYLMGQSSAVYKDLAERQSAYYTNTLAAWFETWEQEVNRKLLSANAINGGAYYCKANGSKLVKGSPNTLADFTGKLRTQGVISGNEAREMFGMNPVEGLDDYSNPNTSTGDEESDTGEAEPRVDEPGEDDNDAQDAVAYHFRALIRRERKRVIGCVGRKRPFLDSIRDYYDEHQRHLETVCNDLGLDPARAGEHCQESKRIIAQHAAVVDPAGLADALDEITQDWETRAENFACSMSI